VTVQDPHLGGAALLRAAQLNGWSPGCFGHETAEVAVACFHGGGCAAKSVRRNSRAQEIA
jgi:hypothetical protein